MGRTDRASAREFLHLCWAAALYRYRAGWRGPVFLLLSLVDVLVYAAVLSIVVQTVFALGGVERFMPTLVGLIALRWSLSCAIQASRTAHFAQIYRSPSIGPLLGTTVLAIAGPTFIFAVSLAILTAVLVFAVREPAHLAHMVGWGLFVAVVQLVWNCVLALAVIQMRLRQFLLSEVPIVFGFILLLIISPVAYQFGDIPAEASRMLTSLNPFSHLIAGYQNAFWYIQDPSLEVLPWAALAGLLFLFLLSVFGRSGIERTREDREGRRVTLIWDGESWFEGDGAAPPQGERRYARWQGELPWINGASFLYLIEPTPNVRARRSAIFGELAGSDVATRVLASPLPLLSHSNRDRLCAASALDSVTVGGVASDNVVPLGVGGAAVTVLDGLLDHAEVEELEALTQLLASYRSGPLALVTYRRRVAEILLADREQRGATR